MPDTCRGTLVVHALPDAECTDANCMECYEPRHELVVPCDDVDGVCPLCALGA